MYEAFIAELKTTTMKSRSERENFKGQAEGCAWQMFVRACALAISRGETIDYRAIAQQSLLGGSIYAAERESFANLVDRESSSGS